MVDAIPLVVPDLLHLGESQSVSMPSVLFRTKDRCASDPSQDDSYLQRFSDQLTEIIIRIDDAAARAAEIITSTTPLRLLTRAATMYAVTQMGVEVEEDIKREHAIAANASLAR